MDKDKTPSDQEDASKLPLAKGISKYVVLTLGEGTKSKIFRLHKERVVIGSVESSDVRLDGDKVAPIHAVLEVQQHPTPGSSPATVYDLASDSGVFVNGEKVVTQELKQGDVIKVGDHELKLSVGDVSTVKPSERVWESEGRKLFLNPDEDFKPLNLQDDREIVEIFDYTSAKQQALQIIMSWRGTVLSVEHFVDEPQVTVGTTKNCDFGIPPLLSTGRFPIVTKRGTTRTLNIETQMKGVLQRKGELRAIDEIKQVAPQGNFGKQVALEKGDFVKVQVGEIDFFLSFTAAPPRLKRRKLFERDPFFLKVVMSSLVFTTVTLVALFNVEVEEVVEVEELPERIVTILYQPEKYTAYTRPKKPPTPPKNPVKPKVTPKKKKPKKVVLDIKPSKNKPKKTAKTLDLNKPKKSKNVGGGQKKAAQAGQSEAREGQGARAKGASGVRGKPDAPKGDVPQTAAKRPSPRGGSGRGSGRSRVRNDGNIDFLKGASSKILNLLGNSGGRLGGSGKKIEGFGGFTTQGGGGLALEGTGRGGGGTADSLGGLSDRGRGGGRVGTGLGAAGKGAGIIGGKTRVAIRTGGPEEAVVMGSIDADAVEAALLAHKDEFRLCYEREINTGSAKISGRVGTSFIIGARGRVTRAGVMSSSLKSPPVERCILKIIRRIDFPTPRGGGIVEVRYPFKFRSTSR